MKQIKIVDELAYLAARHKLVPFLGAGCSKPHLRYDWPSLTIEMAGSLKIDPSLGPLAVAQEFVDREGNTALCEYLKPKLSIDKFEDSLGSAHLAMLSLGIGLIYTTNQDNVFEQCVTKYNRQWRMIIQLEDLASYTPGEPLYIKYHGDLSYPDTVIFSEKAYEARVADTNNFLNIRLKSDLLAKNLLFIGYSFGDDTIKNIFRELKGAFGGKLPASYLISYKSSDELEEVCGEFGVRLVDPYQELQRKYDCPEAFERFLTSLVNTTYEKKCADGLQKFFTTRCVTTPIVTKYEIQALENQIQLLTVDKSVQLLKDSLSFAEIPLDFQKLVGDFVQSLCEKCSTRDESDKLCNLLEGLRLNEVQSLRVTSAVFSTANCRGDQIWKFDAFSPRVHDGKYDCFSMIIVAMAIDMLKAQGKQISPTFQYYAKDFIAHGHPLDQYPGSCQEYIKDMFKEVWKGDENWKRTRESFTNRSRYRDRFLSCLKDLPRSNKLPTEE